MSTGSTHVSTQSQIAIMVSAILLHAVFLGEMGVWLWGREHYPYFPMVLLASASLAWFRLSGIAWDASRRVSLRIFAGKAKGSGAKQKGQVSFNWT